MHIIVVRVKASVKMFFFFSFVAEIGDAKTISLHFCVIHLSRPSSHVLEFNGAVHAVRMKAAFSR